ncbi:ABC-type oligopeptide transporter ABCB9 [Saccoglossus kowalevskii]|uniref:ATP-binding cassette sub-family B member 9 n=1 Tax=Saccoglossus kowalevskii TaxID=10224 RepID=A0ABM0M6W0_SACKO|nr:PREDICTED: ATP-binding cassette sub-family B member 9 [Saccoglossus kowalevskii]
MVCNVKILLTLFVSLADLALTTILFIHGHQFDKFTTEIYKYSFSNCFIDIWFLSVLRFAILFGASVAVLCNAKDAVPRLQYSSGFVLSFCGLMFTYLIVKLLFYSEHQKDLRQPWFWGLFACTTVCCVCLYLLWKLLSSVKPRRPHLSINAEDGNTEESAKLLSDYANEHDLNKPERGDYESHGIKKKANEKRSTVLRLLSYTAPDFILLIIAFIALLATSIGEIFLPLFTGKVIDGIVVNKDYNEFTHAITVMALISAGTALTSGLRGTLFMIVMARLNIRIRNCLYSSIASQDIGFFDCTKTGDITSRLTSDTTVMSDSIALNLNVFLRNSVKSIGYLVLMFKLSWQLTIVTLIMIPLVAVVAKVYGKYYKKLSRMVQDTLALANNVAEETLSSMKTVRSFAHEIKETAKYADKLHDTYLVKLKEAFAYGGFVVTNRFMELTIDVILLFYGGHLVLTDRLTPGNLISFILYNLELGDALESLEAVYTGLMQAAGAAEKVFELMDREPKITNTGRLMPGNVQGQIEFKNVSFTYPSRPDVCVLKNVTFKASPGEVIALVGPSGGGKSTCVNLIEHFYEPTSGSILLDNIPIQQYDHEYLHNKVAMVGQEPILYARSIRENIAYAMENHCTFDKVKHAAVLANAHKFISELKDGYDTEVGEKGTQISGGQKQRIAIARALIRDPIVLLLDEATSALDSESEYMVQQAIYGNLQNRTVLIVAHRLSTIEKANRIIVIDKGTVAEQGSHLDLLAQNGLYAQLVQRQLLSTNITQDDEPPELTNPNINGPITSVPLNPINQLAFSPDNNSDDDSESFLSSPGGITFSVGSYLM